MIVAIRDLGGSNRVVNEVTAAIAGHASHSGFNTLVLQFSGDSEYTIDKLLYAEDSKSDGYFAETGIDALLSEAALNNISKEIFQDTARAFTKNYRLDVAEVSKQENFHALLAEKQMEVSTLLTSAGSAYDLVLVPFGARSEKEIFGAYGPELMPQFDMVVWTVRQGSKNEDHDHYPNEMYILTGYKEDSKYTAKVMNKRINAGKSAILPLSVPTAFRDAVDDMRLVVFLRKAKAGENDPVSDTLDFTQQLSAIIAMLGMKESKNHEEVWNEVEFNDERIGLFEAKREDPEEYTESDFKETAD